MPSEFAHHWSLDPNVTFLNHGSFGATPRPVLAAQTALRERMEREPVAFFARDLEPALDAARGRLGGFVGADPDDLAFVPNATAGINIVARSLHVEPGDEILVHDHAYNAARNALTAVADAAGARIVDVPLPFPGTAEDAVVEAFVAAVTPRTRLALVDHVTSPTALVLPVERIVGELAARGVDTLVDGAHAPGMVDVDLDRIGAAYTVGNCHKWLCAPKGSGFLHVRRDRQARVRPLAISHGANSPRRDRSRFRLEHDWTGTHDPTAWLAVPAAIDFGDRILPGGWPALRDRNRAIARRGLDIVAGAIGAPRPAAEPMLGAMIALPLPETRDQRPIDLYADPLHAALVARGVQVAIAPWPPRDEPGAPWTRLVRFSVAPYTDSADLERLAEGLVTLGRNGAVAPTSREP